MLASCTTPKYKRSSSGRIPGKVILTGEHGVVYGARALAMPLSTKRLSMEVEAQETNCLISMNGKNVSPSVSTLVDQGLQLLSLPKVPLRFRGQSDITIGAGLGSSAAFCVSIVKSLVNLFDLVLSPMDLARIAGSMEAYFHGKPSGLDTTVVAYDCPILFRREHDPIPLDLGLGAPEISPGLYRWPFVLVDSSMRSSTKVMVQIASEHFKGRGGDRLIEQFDQSTMNMMQAMYHGHLKTVGAIIDQVMSLLREIGVVNSCLQNIADDLKDLGVLATKPTGAGGGGYLLTLLNPQHYREQLQAIINQFGRERVIEVMN